MNDLNDEVANTDSDPIYIIVVVIIGIIGRKFSKLIPILSFINFTVYIVLKLNMV